MSRLYAVLLSVAVLAAVAYPIGETLELPEDRTDSFPLSYYPALAAPVAPELVEFEHCVGVEMGGRRVPIPYRYWGAESLEEGRQQLAARVVAAEADGLCRRVAAEVLRSSDPALANVAQVQVVRGVYKPLDYFGGRKDPTSLRVLAETSLRRDFPVAREEFPRWLERHVRGLAWNRNASYPRMIRPGVAKSQRLAHWNVVANQRTDGRFLARYDFVQQRDGADDQASQAYAAWALATLHGERGSDPSGAAVDKALAFFLDRTEPGTDERALRIRYPGAAECETQTVALVALAIMDYVAAAKEALPEQRRDELVGALAGYVRFVESMRLESGRFAAAQSLAFGERGEPSAESDGAALLCLVRAARQEGFERLVPGVEKHVPALARHYTVAQWAHDPRSDETLRFFPWSCQAFAEFVEAGWKGGDVARGYLEAVAWWLVRTYRVLDEPGNPVAALQGLVPVYGLARDRKLRGAAAAELFATIDRLLQRTATLQVEGLYVGENPFLLRHRTKDPRAVGAVLASAGTSELRLELTARYAQAALLALQGVYSEGKR